MFKHRKKDREGHQGGPMALLLLVSVFVIATCGLVYELIASTLASYLLGDSVTQFSTIIGCYLFAMGIGSWLSRYVTRNLLAMFVKVEVLVGAIGGGSAAVLFLLFDHVTSFRVPLYGLVGVLGVLVGIEIPLLLRILKDRFAFADLVSRVFTFDYVGALFASVLFPLVLVPHLGLVRTAFLFGMLNVGVALWLLYAVRDAVPHLRAHRAGAWITLALLAGGFAGSERIMSIAEASTYPGTVIYATSTPYQRIVLTKTKDDIRLFLNSNLQFSSVDEYRYHEALVHPVMAALDQPRNILVIGGGDGLAAREILKYPSVERITLVDLDPAMTKLFSTSPMLTALNHGSLTSPKLHVINADAFGWAKAQAASAEPPQFDAMIIDVPDPSNFSIGKLYSTAFYRQLIPLLKPAGLMVIQSTSPLVARKAFWCVDNTLRAVGLRTAAYHVLVPAFGDWGYVIAGREAFTPPAKLPEGLRYLDPESLAEMFHFPLDMAWIDTKIQRLDDQPLVRYFDEEWSRFLIY